MKKNPLRDNSYQRVLIALPGGGNPMYFSYYLEILNLLKKSGAKVLLVETIRPSLKSFTPWMLDLCFRKYSQYRFQTMALKQVWSPKATESQKSSGYFDTDFSTMSDLKLHSTEHPSLGKSLYSEFATAVALTSDPNFSVIHMQNRIHRMIRKYLYSHEKSRLAVEFFQPDAIIILNGRFLQQAASKDVAADYSIPVYFLEHGGQPGEKYHLELFQTQDRLEFQKSYFGDVTRTHIPTEKIDALLYQYQTNSLLNPFIANRLSQESKKNGQGPLASIFTSSIDEEISCPNWNNDNVENLTNRTISISNYLMGRGYQVIVAIHPNAMNKSWTDLSLQVRTLTQNGIAFMPPWSDSSSYKLLGDSDLVVTWRSTIGLEAAAYGKELLVISDSHFDLILSEEQSDLSHFGHYFPFTIDNQNAAKDYLFHLRNHGYQLTQELDRKDKLFLSFMYVLMPLGGVRRALQRRLRPIFNLISRKYTPSDYFWLLNKLRFRNYKQLEKKLFYRVD